MVPNKHPLAKCGACTLCASTYVPSVVVPEGTLVFVGEAPGAEEAQHGIPFVGPSGRLLRTAIERVGADQAAASFINVVACRPPSNREPTPDEVAACSERFEAELELAGGTIVALGRTAMERLQPEGELTISKARGIFTERNGRRMLTTWHPAYVLRKQSEMEAFMADMRKATTAVSVGVLPTPRIRIIRELSELQEWAAEVMQMPKGTDMAFDIETNQLQWFDKPDLPADPILMLAFAWGKDEAAIICDGLLYDTPGAVAPINQLFEHFSMVGHNSKFDVVFLHAQTAIKAYAVNDTLLAHYALNEQPGTHGLKMLAQTYLGLGDYEAELVQQYLTSRNDEYSKVPFEHLSHYAAIDVCVTLQLWHILQASMQRQGLDEKPYQMYMRASRALTEVELHGMYVDREALAIGLKQTAAEMAEALEALTQAAGREINPNSPKQLAELFYDELRLPAPQGRKISDRATSKDALDQLKGKHPAVDAMLRYRRPAKIQSAYLNNISERIDTGGRVHATFQIHGTETGRLSVRDPALQTIPRESTDAYGKLIRNAFGAAPGNVLVVADYSQAELRVLGALSGEPFLLDVYRQGRDLHTEAAKRLFGENWTKEQRNLCKMMNFSYAYGGSEYSLAETSGIPVDQARGIVREYDKIMTVAKQWKIDQFAFARLNGYVSTRFGRRRRFPVIDNINRDEVRKASINMPVQSTASDLTLTAAIRLIELDYNVVLLVHDSIIVECPEGGAQYVGSLMKNVMVDAGASVCPEVVWKADVDIVHRWGAKE